MKISVIITAAGYGKRMGKPKQFLPILGRPLLEWTVSVFKKIKEINQIILVVNKEDIKSAENLGVEVVEGGKERQDSVKNGLDRVAEDTDLVLIHDGARPLITREIILKAIKECEKHGAVIVGVPVKDTIKKVQAEDIILETIDRTSLWAAQTPQVFKYAIIKRAYDNIKGIATDDSKLVEDLGYKVKMILGSYENLKITTPEDLILAEAMLRQRHD